jgi:hypothetical protein
LSKGLQSSFKVKRKLPERYFLCFKLLCMFHSVYVKIWNGDDYENSNHSN